jgi:surface polysaccharide O-acyltransferase-like enzyme
MFLSHIHNFRGIAILVIVAFHSIAVVKWGKFSKAEYFLRDIFCNGSVYFVFIAGFLFQHLIQKYKFRTFIIKKIQNVLAPYIIISMPAIAYLVLSNGIQNFQFEANLNEESILYQIAWLYLTGMSLFPFWFIPMIFIFYLISPLLRLMDRNGKVYYLLPILLTLSFLVHRPEYNLGVLHSFVYFFPIYLFGMWASRHENELFYHIEKFSTLIVCLWLIVFATNFLYAKVHGNLHSVELFSAENGIFDIELAHKLIACLIFIYYLKKYDNFIRKLKLGYLADRSFGVYFIHGYLLIFLVKLNELYTIDAQNIVKYFLSVVLIVISSIAFLQLSKKIFRSKSRYITGF